MQPHPIPQLAARIAVSNLHKNTLKSFSETCVGGGAVGVEEAGAGSRSQLEDRSSHHGSFTHRGLCEQRDDGFALPPPRCCYWLSPSVLTPPSCSVKIMRHHVNPKNGEPAPLVAEDVYDIIIVR